MPPGPPGGTTPPDPGASSPASPDDALAQVHLALPAAVAVVRPDGSIASANPAWRRFIEAHGIAAGAGFFEAVPQATAMPPEQAARVADGARAVVDGRSPRVDVLITDREPGRPTVWQHLVATPLDTGRPDAGVVVVVLDVTASHQAAEDARAALEEQIRQSQKIEAVGRLAGGVAHDFNNLLTVIIGYNEALDFEEALGESARDAVQQIRLATERATVLTRQLLAFSRRQVLQPQAFDLRTVVRQLVPMLRRLIGEDVELETTLCESPAVVKADPGQIEQVLMNLAVNGRQAMPKGGRLSVRVGMADLDAAFVAAHPYVVPGRYVELTVADTGVGMPNEVKARVFEPFFTTKPSGQGTGLGLAMVYGIVKQSSGYIWVESEPGRGAAFRMVLPFVETDTVVEAPAPAPSGTPGGHETVLLVEDEDALRELDRQVLMRYGYRVLHARTGPEALAVAQAHPGPIHLLLTDVVMPSMSGREVADHLKALQPEVRVLYMSGYTSDAVVRHGITEATVAFIQKPMTPPELARKVREVLDQR